MLGHSPRDRRAEGAAVGNFAVERYSRVAHPQMEGVLQLPGRREAGCVAVQPSRSATWCMLFTFFDLSSTADRGRPAAERGSFAAAFRWRRSQPSSLRAPLPLLLAKTPSSGRAATPRRTGRPGAASSALG